MAVVAVNGDSPWVAAGSTNHAYAGTGLPDRPPVSAVAEIRKWFTMNTSPSVTMARYSPLSRRVNTPTNTPTRAATRPAAGRHNQNGTPPCLPRIAVAYAPRARNAAWPRLICPAKPVSTMRAVLPTMATSARLPTVSQRALAANG